MDNKQIWDAWNAFRHQQELVEGGDQPFMDVAKDLTGRCMSIGLMGAGIPAIASGILLAIDFGRYMERLEQEQKQLQELTRDNRPQS